MKTKLLILSALLFVAGFTTVARADDRRFKPPVGDNRVADPGLKSVGVNNVILVTSTNAVLATDVDGDTITNGLLYWVAFSTSAALHLEVRGSTDTANLTSTRALPRIGHLTGTTNPVIYFDPPVPWTTGLSLNLGPAGRTPVAGEDDVAVGVRWLR